VWRAKGEVKEKGRKIASHPVVAQYAVLQHKEAVAPPLAQVDPFREDARYDLQASTIHQNANLAAV